MPNNTEFLTPVLALVAWTLIMWIWMYATRLPAFQKAGVDPQDAMHPGTYHDKIPSEVRRIADNYNHLHEAPTIFYALMGYVFLTGGGDQIATYMAWAYVGLRVVHSIVQSTANVVAIRFLLFALSTVVLMALTVKSALPLLG